MNKQNLNILHWVNFFNKGLNEDNKKEGLFKRLKNIETNQKNNNNDKSELSTPLNCARIKSNTKTLNSDDDETQTSFEYLKNNTDEFFNDDPDIFYLDLKNVFKYIASQEEIY